MQNGVDQYIINEVNCFVSYSVTCLPFGNYPANGLVTEILLYFTLSCFQSK